MHYQINKVMEIKILGVGCHKCKALEKLTREVKVKGRVPSSEEILKILTR